MSRNPPSGTLVDGTGLSFAIVAASYNGKFVERLRGRGVDTLKKSIRERIEDCDR